MLSLSIVPPSGSSLSQVLQTYCLQVTYASASGASSGASDCTLLNASSVQLAQLNVLLSPRAALCLIRRHDICSNSASIAGAHNVFSLSFSSASASASTS